MYIKLNGSDIITRLFEEIMRKLLVFKSVLSTNFIHRQNGSNRNDRDELIK